jgi:hypothetical protein
MLQVVSQPDALLLPPPPPLPEHWLCSAPALLLLLYCTTEAREAQPPPLLLALLALLLPLLPPPAAEASTLAVREPRSCSSCCPRAVLGRVASWPPGSSSLKKREKAGRALALALLLGFQLALLLLLGPPGVAAVGLPLRHTEPVTLGEGEGVELREELAEALPEELRLREAAALPELQALPALLEEAMLLQD